MAESKILPLYRIYRMTVVVDRHREYQNDGNVFLASIIRPSGIVNADDVMELSIPPSILVCSCDVQAVAMAVVALEVTVIVLVVH